MDSLLDVMLSRRSAREFDSFVVPEEDIQKIVEAVRRTPSSKNTQPWRLRLFQGESMEKLRNGLVKNFDDRITLAPELNLPLLSQYRPRAVALGAALFAHKGIVREDREARRRHDRRNFELFDAPQAFVMGVQRGEYHEGTILDCGIFLGYLLLAIEAAGYRSCPQMSPLTYPKVFVDVAPDDTDTRYFCVIPFGKPKEGAHVNDFVTEREPADVWFRKI